MRTELKWPSPVSSFRAGKKRILNRRISSEAASARSRALDLVSNVGGGLLGKRADTVTTTATTPILFYHRHYRHRHHHRHSLIIVMVGTVREIARAILLVNQAQDMPVHIFVKNAESHEAHGLLCTRLIAACLRGTVPQMLAPVLTNPRKSKIKRI